MNNNNNNNNNSQRQLQEQELQIQWHLDWSHRQRRILTAEGRAEEYYTAANGFPFAETELPQYYSSFSFGTNTDRQPSLLPTTTTTTTTTMTTTTRSMFAQWKQQQEEEEEEEEAQQRESDNNNGKQTSIIVGAWTRPLFWGEWEHSTDHDEHVFNLQTKTLFVDLRIPTTRQAVWNNHDRLPQQISSLNDLTWEQLRYYARQHIFAGYSRVFRQHRPFSSRPKDFCCTRHHCIDWNYVGVPRNRPNKWWIEPKCDTTRNDNQHETTTPSTSTTTPNVWKEWSYATNPQTGQAYYGERWERLAQGGGGGGGNIHHHSESPPPPPPLVMALRKRATHTPPDGIIVMVDDHFNYCIDRVVDVGLDDDNNNHGHASLVDLVDAAVAKGDRKTAQQWLSMQGGHGRIRCGSRCSTTTTNNNNNNKSSSSDAAAGEGCWMIDCAVEFWKHDTPLWIYGDTVTVQEHALPQIGHELSSSLLEQGACTIWWNHEPWDIFETNLQTVQQLKDLLATGRYV